MNRFQLGKFMLLTVAFWLALAVASAAQTCTDTCTSGNYCGSRTTPCNVTVSQTGTPPAATVNPDPVCVAPGTTIKWVPAAAAGIIIGFQGTASPMGTTMVFAGTAAGVSGTVPTNQGYGCFKYSVAYCPSGQACATPIDPKVIVGPGPGPGLHKKKKKHE